MIYEAAGQNVAITARPGGPESDDLGFTVTIFILYNRCCVETLWTPRGRLSVWFYLLVKHELLHITRNYDAE